MCSILINAIIDNDINKVEELLKKGINPNFIDFIFIDCKHMSLNLNEIDINFLRYDIIKYFKENNIDKNEYLYYISPYFYPLILSVLSINHTKITKLLLEYNAEVNFSLNKFIYNKHHNIFKNPFNKFNDFSINVRSSPLYCSYCFGNIEATKLLIRYNANITEEHIKWNSHIIKYDDNKNRIKNQIKIYEKLFKSFIHNCPNLNDYVKLNNLIDKIKWEGYYQSAIHEIWLNNGVNPNKIKEKIMIYNYDSNKNYNEKCKNYFIKQIDKYIKKIKIKQIINLILCYNKITIFYSEDIFINIYKYLKYDSNMVKNLNLSIDINNHFKIPNF